MTDLKPCPFCGHDPQIVTTMRYPGNSVIAKKCYSVVCYNYECLMYRNDMWYRERMKDAVKDWNRRSGDDVGQ